MATLLQEERPAPATPRLHSNYTPYTTSPRFQNTTVTSSRQLSDGELWGDPLPPPAADARNGQANVYSTYAITMTLFTSIEASLLTINIPSSPFSDGFRGGIAIQRLYLFLTYSAFVLNFSATISALYLVNYITSISFMGTSKKPPSIRQRSVRQLLTYYIPEGRGVSRGAFHLMDWHFRITTYMGFVCIFFQVLCYIWLTEVNLMATVLASVMVIALIPLILVIFL